MIFGRGKGPYALRRLLQLVVVLLVLVGAVARFRKMPTALLIRNGKLRNFAYTFVTSFRTDLPSYISLIKSLFPFISSIIHDIPSFNPMHTLEYLQQCTAGSGAVRCKPDKRYALQPGCQLALVPTPNAA